MVPSSERVSQKRNRRRRITIEYRVNKFNLHSFEVKLFFGVCMIREKSRGEQRSLWEVVTHYYHDQKLITSVQHNLHSGVFCHHITSPSSLFISLTLSLHHYIPPYSQIPS